MSRLTKRLDIPGDGTGFAEIIGAAVQDDAAPSEKRFARPFVSLVLRFYGPRSRWEVKRAHGFIYSAGRITNQRTRVTECTELLFASEADGEAEAYRRFNAEATILTTFGEQPFPKRAKMDGSVMYASDSLYMLYRWRHVIITLQGKQCEEIHICNGNYFFRVNGHCNEKLPQGVRRATVEEVEAVNLIATVVQ